MEIGRLGYAPVQQMEEKDNMRKLVIGDMVKIAKKVNSSKYTQVTTRGGGNCAVGFDETKQGMLGREGLIVDTSRNGELFLVRVMGDARHWWPEDLALSSKWRRGSC